MRILPPSTRPWKEPIKRCHTPIMDHRTRFKAFRPCLRWEFGFSCAFCLLHEADFKLGEGPGTFQIEHYFPASQDPDKKNLYGNAFYICRLCSIARGSTPAQSSAGDQLLNPTEVAWSEHFRLVEDEILPLAGDRNATYTAEVYDFNDQRKVAMRRLRRLSLRRRLDFLRDSGKLERRLLERGREPGDGRRLELAQKLRSYVGLAYQDLSSYVAIPADADTQCLCGTTLHHVLPDCLNEQTLSLSGKFKGA